MPTPPSSERLPVGLTLDRDCHMEKTGTERERSDIPTAHYTCKVTEAGGGYVMY